MINKTGSYGAQANGGKRHFVHIHEGNQLCITQANRSHRYKQLVHIDEM